MDILVAEDDRTCCVLLTRLLGKLGHTVVALENGRLAWDTYKNCDYRVVISDWSMPEMDGIELCQEIRGGARKNYCYFILLTGRSDKENLICGLDAGADDYLVKPVHP
ncbi:MAG: response regulator, partial [Blastocatellia bacterium]